MRRRTTGPQKVPAARLHTWTASAILALVALTCYANSFGVPFIYDDVSGIVDNSHIRQLLPLKTLLTAPPQTPVSGRSFVGVSFALNYFFGGLSPWGYHAVNLAILWGTSLLLFAVVRRTLNALDAPAPIRRVSSDVFALAAASIWLVHPLQTEVVDYVVQRTESAMGFFLMLTLYAAIRVMRQPRSWLWHSVAIVACALGVASKESMVTAPVLVLLYDVAFVGGSLAAAVRARKALYAGLSSSWLLLAFLVAGGPRSTTAGFSAGVSPFTYLLNQGPMIATYLKLAVWPHPLLIDYGPAQAVDFARALPAVLLVAALAFAAVALFMTRPRVGFIALWFFITLAPASSLVPIASEVGAERRMFLPMMAIVVAGVSAAAMLLQRYDGWSSKAIDRLLVAGSASICIVLGTITVQRNREYMDQLALWQNVVSVRPHGRAHVSLGAALQQRGQIDSAIEQYRTGAELGRSEAFFALGLAFDERRQWKDAADAYQQFVTLDKRDYRVPDAYTRLGRALVQQGQRAEAEASFRRVFAMEPGNPDARHALADLLSSESRFDEAATEYRQYLALQPRDSGAFGDLGRALVGLNRPTEAVDAFQKAVELTPTSTSARMNFGLALASVARLQDAEAQYREGIRLAPNYAPLASALGTVLAAQGRTREAGQAFERALALDPDNPLVQADVQSTIRSRREDTPPSR